MKLFCTSLSLLLLFNVCLVSSYAQSANQSLSNLTPTAINKSLVPASSDTLTLGSKTKQWRVIYFKGAMFSDTVKVVNLSGSNVGLGRFTLRKNQGTNFGGYSNTAIGDNALSSNTTGYLNTAVGATAMIGNQDGWWNTAVGTECLYSNTSGTENTAMGEGALFANTRGRSNTAVGSQSMTYMQTGRFNTAIGESSMGILTYGSNNTAIGEYTLHQSEASGNTALGTDAGSYYPNGDNNTFVGFNTYSTDLYFTNSTALGYDTHITASNQVRIGNSSVTSIGGVVSWSNLSDGRYKKNIQPNVPGIAFINALRPITYTLDAKGLEAYYKKDLPQKKDAMGNIIQEAKTVSPDLDKQAGIVYSGFVAQDVEAAAKKLNYAFSGVDAPKNAKDLYGLRYSEFVVPLVKAVQDLSFKNDSLTAALSSLRQEVADLKALVTASTGTDRSSQAIAALTAVASLQQNNPNPARQSTQITYSLPSGSANAELLLMNTEGKLVRQVSLAGGKGSVRLDVAGLPAGTYNYTLFANGTALGSRQMMVAR